MLTNPSALRCWMVAGPEIARIVAEFKDLESQCDTSNVHHREQHPGVQSAFLKEVTSLVAVIEEMGNSFLKSSADLMVLDTRDILDSSVGKTMQKVESLRREQYKLLVEERFILG